MCITTVELLEPLKTLTIQQEKVPNNHNQKIEQCTEIRTLTGLNLMEAIAENAKRRHKAFIQKASLN